MTVSSLYKSRKEMTGRRKKGHSTRSTLNLKLLSFKESLGNYLSLYSCNTSSVYRNESYRGHCGSIRNDIETNSRPIPIEVFTRNRVLWSIDPTLTIKAPCNQVDIVYLQLLVKMLENVLL